MTRNFVKEYREAHPENVVWAPETGWADEHAEYEMYAETYLVVAGANEERRDLDRRDAT